jgi:hypothetical protein
VNPASSTSVVEFHDSTLLFCGTMTFPAHFDQTKAQKAGNKLGKKKEGKGTPDIH